MTHGTKITYQTIASGMLLGVVQSTGQDQYGSFVRFKVTSKNNYSYRAGEIVTVGADSDALAVR